MTDYKSILKHYWGYDNFRGIQEGHYLQYR